MALCLVQRESHAETNVDKNVYVGYKSWQLSGCTTAGRLAVPYLTTEKIKLAVSVIAVTTLYIHAPCVSCFHLYILYNIYNILSISTAKNTEAKPKCKLPFKTRGALKQRELILSLPRPRWTGLTIRHKRMPPLLTPQKPLIVNNPNLAVAQATETTALSNVYGNIFC